MKHLMDSSQHIEEKTVNKPGLGERIVTFAAALCFAAALIMVTVALGIRLFT